MPEVVEFNRIEDLEDLRLTWSALLPGTRGVSFYHTLDWLQAYWRHAGENQKLRLLLVTSDRTPIGILPLTVTREATRVGTVRVLTYPLHDWGTYYGPIGPNPTATLTLAMRHLGATQRDWDMLDLRWVNRDEHDHLRTQWAMEHAGFAVREAAWKTTALVDMTGRWDDYWNSRTSKFRNNLGRDEQRLHELGRVKFIRYRPQGAAHGDCDPRWDLFDACVDIARDSWQGSSTTGTTLSHDEVRVYFQQTHALAVKNGMLDLNLVTVDNRPIAFTYNYACQGNVIGVRRGQRREFNKQGVGNVISQWMIRDSFNRGDRCLDLGPGSLETKKKWATRLANSYRYSHYPWSAPRAQLLRLKHWTDASWSPASGELAHA